MKSILLSIKPQYAEKILNGEKTIEIRKHDIPVETKVYIYVCKNKLKLFFKKLIKKFVCALKHEEYEEELNGKVVASFVVSKCEEIDGQDYVITKSCLTYSQLFSYLCDKKGFAWHISNLEIFDKPKELSNFKKVYKCKNRCCFIECPELARVKDNCYICMKIIITKAPQSYCYVEEVE